MYQCGFCGEMSQPGEGCKLVVVERRVKEYPSQELPRLPGEFKRRWSNSGKGFETVCEEKICPRCAADPKNAHLIQKPLESTQEPNVRVLEAVS
jgi:hypothetical protein